MSQQYCLRWNNHQHNLLSVFEDLLHHEAFVDVTLACDGLQLKAHKMVLSACSPYFKVGLCLILFSIQLGFELSPENWIKYLTVLLNTSYTGIIVDIEVSSVVGLCQVLKIRFESKLQQFCGSHDEMFCTFERYQFVTFF